MGKSMSEVFKGYSKYSDNEYKQIWEDGIIVIDTNILLNFYRYSNETREELYKTLEAVKDRLWIPYQVAYEYFKDKKIVITDTYKAFNELLSETKSCFNKLSNTIENTATKQLKCKNDVLKKLNTYYKEIHNIIKTEQESKKENANEEKVENLIFNLFNNSIGDKIIGDEYEKMKEEGLNRIRNKIPPGYKDSNKEENGDYYIFYSMIKYAKEKQKHIIFITDDTKEDWFIRILGEKKGGDYRLLNEFYKETGKLLLIYTSDGFLKAYQENIGNNKKVDEEVLKELINTRKSDNRNSNILNIKHKNYELARELRNVLLHNSITDNNILNILEKYYHQEDIDSSLKENLKLLHLAYLHNNENLKNEILISLEKYLGSSYQDKYSENSKFKIKIARIIENIDYTIKYNKELNINNFCDILNDELCILSNALESLNSSQIISSQERIEELRNVLQYAKDNKLGNEKIMKNYLISKVQDTLYFIKENINYML